MVEKTQILDAAIKHLENLVRRPVMYLGTSDVKRVESYLDGFEAGCATAGLVVSREIYIAAAESRGWKFSAYGVVPSMQERNLTGEEIILELAQIEIESLRRAAADSSLEQ